MAKVQPTSARTTPPERPGVSAAELDATALLARYWGLADSWRLTLTEQMVLAGVDRPTIYAWRQGDAQALEPAVAGRLARLFAVDAALRSRLERPERAHEWLRKPHRSSLLSGRAPLHALLAGSGDALRAVARIVATGS